MTQVKGRPHSQRSKWHACTQLVSYGCCAGQGGSYLVGTGSKAQAELSAYHHSLADAPVLTTDSAPALTTPNLYQHLHPAFWWNSATNKPHLWNQWIKWVIYYQFTPFSTPVPWVAGLHSSCLTPFYSLTLFYNLYLAKCFCTQDWTYPLDYNLFYPLTISQFYYHIMIFNSHSKVKAVFAYLSP